MALGVACGLITEDPVTHSGPFPDLAPTIFGWRRRKVANLYLAEHQPTRADLGPDLLLTMFSGSLAVVIVLQHDTGTPMPNKARVMVSITLEPVASKSCSYPKHALKHFQDIPNTSRAGLHVPDIPDVLHSEHIWDKRGCLSRTCTWGRSFLF
ncbi:hypothetical protein Bbelb_190980 [Branchiostoma belcheri]|nr:hypothetical protein Bbelb_190980 [Branchiostoma belcheri]